MYRHERNEWPLVYARINQGTLVYAGIHMGIPLTLYYARIHKGPSMISVESNLPIMTHVS